MRRACAWALVLLCACVAPARSFSAYEGKAANTAEEAASAGQSAILGVRAASEAKIFAPALSVLLGEAEKDAGAAAGTFESVQPPDAHSDVLRDELTTLLDSLIEALEDLRIAVRRGKLTDAPSLAAPLPGLVEKLQRFAEDHG